MLNAVAETPNKIRWTEGRTAIDWGYGDSSTFEHDGETPPRTYTLIMLSLGASTDRHISPIMTTVYIESNYKGNPIETNYQGNPIEVFLI